MEGVELEYRAVLSLIYSELVADLKSLHVIYEETPSCISMASALAALLMNRGVSVSASPVSKLGKPVESAFLAMGPYRDDLAEAVAAVLPLVEKTAVLHTPAYYAAEELRDFPKMIEGKEVRYAVREEPGEITFYKVVSRGGELEKSAIGRRRLTGAESEVIRRYESLHAI